MRVDSLSIALFYESPEAGTWSLYDLTRHRGVIAPDDLAPDAFFNAAGAIRLYCDRVKCFLSTGAAGELRGYVYFLLESLVALSGSDLSGEFPELSTGSDFFGEESVLAGLFQDNQTRLMVQEASDSEVAISFLDPTGKAPEERLSPYFRGFAVGKRAWQVAAIEGLDEYFSVAAERLQAGGGSELRELASRWGRHRSVLGSAARIAPA